MSKNNIQKFLVNPVNNKNPFEYVVPQLAPDRLIAFHRNRYDVTEYPKDKLNMAYLDNKFAQFKNHLENSPDELKIKTIKEINEQLQDGDEIYAYSILQNEIMQILFNHLKTNPNTEIRISSSACFKQFCRLNSSKQMLNKLGYLKQMESIINDLEPIVRLNVVDGLIFYSSYREGQEALLENSVFDMCIKAISKEKSQLVLYQLMYLTYEILKCDGSSQRALDLDFINILKTHINSSMIKIRFIVYKNLSSLSMCEHGKIACTEEGSLIENCHAQLSEIIPIFSNLLQGQKDKYNIEDVQNHIVQLTRFLLAVSIIKQGKMEIFKFKGLEYGLKILSLIGDKSNIHEDQVQILINVLQYLGITSEDPSSRLYMLEHTKEIELFEKSENEFISKQATLTLTIIRWKP